jgi:hypothetical protein
MSEMNDFINRICADLERRGVQGIPEYKQKLMDNSASANFEDFLLEGKAALMFREVDFRVTLREAPDLALEFNGEQLYVEVKHFRLKKQDLIDDAKMSEPGDELVPYGDTVPLEGKPAWEQVYNVAKSKIRQYKQNAPNILVIESSSPNCIDDVIILTAIEMVNEAVRSDKCPGFGRLNGILIASLKSYNISHKRNAFFYPTDKPDVPLTTEVVNLLGSISLG